MGYGDGQVVCQGSWACLAEGSQPELVSEPWGQGFLWTDGGRGSVGNVASLMKGTRGWSCHPGWQDMDWNKEAFSPGGSGRPLVISVGPGWGLTPGCVGVGLWRSKQLQNWGLCGPAQSFSAVITVPGDSQGMSWTAEPLVWGVPRFCPAGPVA